MATLCYTVHKQHWAMAKAIQEDTREYNFEARQWLQAVLLSTSCTGHKLQATAVGRCVERQVSGLFASAPFISQLHTSTILKPHLNTVDLTSANYWSHKYTLLILQMYTSDPPTAHSHILYTTFEHPLNTVGCVALKVAYFQSTQFKILTTKTWKNDLTNAHRQSPIHINAH